MPKLTITAAKALAPRDGKPAFLWCSETRGFGLKVTPAGRKVFLFQTEVGGSTKRWTIGTMAGALTVEQARRIAEEWRVKIRLGEDPAAARREAQRKAATVNDLIDAYLRDGPATKPNKKPSSWKQDESNLRRLVSPLIGNVALRDLKQADVEQWQRDVADGKMQADTKLGPRSRSIVRGGKGTAARGLAVLAAMLAWGAAKGFPTDNPARGVQPYKSTAQKRFPTAEETRLLFAALEGIAAEGIELPHVVDCFWLLALTGARKEEIAGLRWEWLDLDGGCIHLPDSKTGSKMLRLAPVAVSILRRQPRLPADDANRDWVFPAGRGAVGSVVGLQRMWARVRKRAQAAADALCEAEGRPPLNLLRVRIHDLRHGFATTALTLGSDLYIIGKALGHKQQRTTAIYAHVADDPLQQAINKTAASIAANLAGAGGADRPAQAMPRFRARRLPRHASA